MEQGVYKKPIGHKGLVWMWSITQEKYVKLSPEDVKFYGLAKRRDEERKKAESPGEIAKREKEDERFMQGFKIVFAVDLYSYLQRACPWLRK